MIPPVIPRSAATSPVIPRNAATRDLLLYRRSQKQIPRFARDDKGNCFARDDRSADRLLCPRVGLDEATDVEVAEVGVLGARFVEAHLGDEPLEVDRVLGEKGYAPLPAIESDRTGDDLRNSASVSTPREAV